VWASVVVFFMYDARIVSVSPLLSILFRRALSLTHIHEVTPLLLRFPFGGLDGRDIPRVRRADLFPRSQERVSQTVV